MKVRELRERIKDLPDNAEILLSVNCGPDELHPRVIMGSNLRKEIGVVIWGNKYNTREVYNAYRANDDRYGGPILLVEVGEESP